MSNQMLTDRNVETILEKLADDAGLSVRARYAAASWDYAKDRTIHRFTLTYPSGILAGNVDVDWDVLDLTLPSEEFGAKLIERYPGFFKLRNMPAVSIEYRPLDESGTPRPITARRAMVEDMAASAARMRSALEQLLKDTDL